MSANLLASETSPYLLQHKDNPVHWRPWGPEALAEAQRLDKPILLSIGYAACHWCHVMAHESFEDGEVATVMNRHFVAIKVDREERPDIDTIYMSALHMLGEPGGWPLTMFLTPAGEPFWGGTYFPKEPRFGRPGFIQVLEEIARIFREEPDKVEQNRAALIERLRAPGREAPDALPADLPDQAAERLFSVFDPVNGGLQGAPKFPQTFVLELFWRAGDRRGDARYRDAAVLSLTRLCQGGIYDHLGGGFARYSVDARWLVPHFEKMLYDNALLLDLLVTAWAATREPLFAARIEETIGWLEREMRLAGGGFASSLDADSEGEEGRFYVWQAAELRALLGSDYEYFAKIYDVSEGGNWEGRVILNRLAAPAWAGEAEEARLTGLRARLLAAREKRPRPARDDKVLADWNGLIIHALARAGFVLARPDWMELARAAFAFIDREMANGERLMHSHRDGRAGGRGLVSDHANMVRAALALHEITGEAGYLKRADAWSDALEAHFLAADGSYYMSPDDADDLIVRPRGGLDDATPNGNAISAANLVRLWHLTGAGARRERAEAIFTAYGGEVRRNVFGYAGLVNAFDFARRAVELVIMLPAGAGGDAAGDLLEAARGTAGLNLILSVRPDGEALPASHPAHGKTSVGGRATAYVCTAAGCSLPVADAQDLRERLAAAAA